MKKNLLPWLSVVAVFLLFLVPLSSDDMFMCLALGRRLVRLGEFGATDPYLFTLHNYPWHLWHEWLAYLIYYGLYSIAGMTGLIALKALLVTAGAALVWRATTRRGAPPALALVLAGLAVTAALPRLGDRASFFSDLLTCWLIFEFTGSRPARVRFWLPAVFLLWVQLHPAFPVGLLVLALYIAFAWKTLDAIEKRRWVIVGILCVAATAINPIGIEGLLYPLRKFTAPEWGIFRQINSEWQSTFSSPYLGVVYKSYLLAWLGASAYAGAFAIRRGSWFTAACALVLAYLALSAVRFLALGGFGAGLILAGELAGFERLRRLFASPLANGLAAASLVGGIVWAFASLNFGPRAIVEGRLVDPYIPVEAARKFLQLPPGNIFNEYDLGGLLVWELDGRMKIAAHGHIDSPALVKSKIMRFSNTREDFEEIVIGGGVEYFFVHRQTIDSQLKAGFVQELTGPRWQLIYQDELAMIFQRRPVEAKVGMQVPL